MKKSSTFFGKTYAKVIKKLDKSLLFRIKSVSLHQETTSLYYG